MYPVAKSRGSASLQTAARKAPASATPAAEDAPQLSAATNTPASPADAHPSSLKVSEDLIRAALTKTLASPEFQSAPQLRAFLKFVVTAALENRLEKIKGYTIATEALGRDDDFNPVTDPIVRVEAARLRRRLSGYYAGTGTQESVRITIPKGSYAPRFSIAPAQAPARDQPGPAPADEPRPPLTGNTKAGDDMRIPVPQDIPAPKAEPVKSSAPALTGQTALALSGTALTPKNVSLKFAAALSIGCFFSGLTLGLILSFAF